MNAKQAEKARAVIGHYVETLGVSVADFARGCNIPPHTLSEFMTGSREVLEDHTAMQLGKEVIELVEAEDRDVEWAKAHSMTPPRTAKDVYAGK
jgi:predicted transcriptional regulator